MTSAATTPASGARRRYAEGHGYGLVLFAAILLAVIGLFNLIYGIAAIANSHVFTANAHYVFGSLRLGLDHPHHRHRAAAGGGRGDGRQPAGPLARRG